LVDDWAYEFYDKGPYTTISFEVITLADQEYELSHQIIRAAVDYDYTSDCIDSELNGYQYNIFRDRTTKDWYIQIYRCGEDYLFDGWWSKSEDENIRAAIVEAIRYAGILEK